MVDQVVNNAGGFLRKPSTLFTYLNQKESQRNQQRIKQFNHLEFFKEIPPTWQRKLTQYLQSSDYSQGTTLYRQGDPSESLYIIEKGKINLLDPKARLTLYQQVKSNNILGMSAFLTGCPHQTVAVAVEDCQLTLLSRHDFE